MAITEWEKRYTAIDPVHHTEQTIYFDAVEQGLYTLAADVLADDTRRVDYCNLSFQLVGVPLESSPMQDLAKAFEVEGTVYFRPLAERVVDGYRLGRDDFVDLAPLGFVVKEELGSTESDSLTVTGVVVRNPFCKKTALPPWWPTEAAEIDILVCDLRSWHPLGDPRSAYHLQRLEWTRTSDAVVFRPVIDWEWKDTASGRPPWQRS